MVKVSKFFFFVIVVVIIFYSLSPLVMNVIYSFVPGPDVPSELRLPEKFTLENYKTTLFYFAPWFPMLNTFVIAISTGFIVLLLAIPAAYAFSRNPSKSFNGLFFFILIIRMFPLVLLLIPIYFLLKSLHLIDTYFGLILSYLPFNVPLAIWLLKGFFDGVPREIEEAATIDGASVYCIVRKIMFPLISEGAMAVFFIVFIYCSFDMICAITLTRTSVPTLVVKIAGLASGMGAPRFGKISSMITISLLPFICIYILVNKYMAKGFTLNIKG